MREVYSAATEKQLCHLLFPTAKVNIADGGNRSPKVSRLAHQALKKGPGAREQYDGGETIARRNGDLDSSTVNKHNGGIEIPQREIFAPGSPSKVWHAQAENGARLPPNISTRVFTIGTKYAGKMMAQKNDPQA